MSMEKLYDTIMEAVRKIAEAFKRWMTRIKAAIVRFASGIARLLRRGKLKRVMAKYEAAGIRWHARGPRRNQALMRAVMMRWRCRA